MSDEARSEASGQMIMPPEALDTTRLRGIVDAMMAEVLDLVPSALPIQYKPLAGPLTERLRSLTSALTARLDEVPRAHLALLVDRLRWELRAARYGTERRVPLTKDEVAAVNAVREAIRRRG